VRNVVLAMFTTLDGFVAGPNGDLVPPPWSDDAQAHWSDANLELAGTVAYGRQCYEGMAQYWQSDDANPATAAALARLPKVVFSRTLTDPTWPNTVVVKGDLVAEVSKLKRAPGKPVVVFGGAELAWSLVGNDLVDEYRLMVTPTILGEGKPLFAGSQGRRDLSLASARALDTGALIVHYRRASPSVVERGLR
jgi:dihydrofolate reductase